MEGVAVELPTANFAVVPSSSSTASSSSSPPPILSKTYDMVVDLATDSIISWSTGGISFVVWNVPELARDVLPKYFKHNNFSSYVRQLNTYLQIAGWLSRYQSAAACAVRKPAAANNGFDGNVKFTNLGPKRGKSKPPEPKSLNGGGVVLLKWGQRKRSKRTVADKSSGGVPMKPPPSKSGGGGGTTGCRGGGVAGGCEGTYLRPPRKLEDKMGGGGGSQSPSWKSDGGSRSISRSVLGKRSHSSTIDGGSKGSTMRKDQSEISLLQSEHPNRKVTSPPPDDLRRHHQQRKSNGEEWPRIHIGLSRKEKEEDFLAIKATKLSHRPKKRSKALDRNLQYCFPGTFLSDLSRSRYEVRERKSVRKPKRGGLKGLESMDSYSD